jgi:putative tricarboxylic transport membrane protein
MGIPGESSSVPTMIDGCQLAKKGKAGKALGIAAVASFIGGTISVVGLMFLGPTLADLALLFGPPEFFALMVMALSLVSAFTGSSLIRGMIAASLGLLLSVVGQDIMTGMPRLTFGQHALLDGIDFIPLGVGMFGLAETIESFEVRKTMAVIKADLGWRSVLPTLEDMKESFMATIRGTFVGFFAGTLPGVGATIAAFLSYGLEKRIAKDSAEFGQGALSGVAAPEAANNASTGGSFIPMLSLGIPGGGTSAVLLGAFIMFGLQPGPSLFRDAPEVVWGLIASMYIGNIMLLIINIAFIPFIVLFMEKVKAYMPLIILLLSVFGVYSYRNMLFDVIVMLIAGIVGYLMNKLDFPPAPVILGLILGGMTENSLRQSLDLSNGNVSIFFTRPIALAFLSLAMALVLCNGWQMYRQKNRLKVENDN